MVAHAARWEVMESMAIAVPPWRVRAWIGHDEGAVAAVKTRGRVDEADRRIEGRMNGWIEVERRKRGREKRRETSENRAAEEEEKTTQKFFFRGSEATGS